MTVGVRIIDYLRNVVGTMEKVIAAVKMRPLK